MWFLCVYAFFFFNNIKGKIYKLQLQCVPKTLEMWAFKCFSAFPIFLLVTDFRFVTTCRIKMTRFLTDIKSLLQIILNYSKLSLKVANS